MPSEYTLHVGGAPATDELVAALGSIEIEENADLPGAIQLSLPISGTEQADLSFVDDPSIGPYASLAVVAQADDGPPECIFDGYVLSHKLHMTQGIIDSSLEVWGQDASCLMNLDEKTREWLEVTDGGVANAIFEEYGFSTAPENTADDSSAHAESGHSLMQRATDIQLLRMLARRNGKLCRVISGREPGQLMGWFGVPGLSGDPVATLLLHDPERSGVQALDFEWDLLRPTEVLARQATFDDASQDGVRGDASDSGLPELDALPLATFAKRPNKALLSAVVDTAEDLSQRARALLREAGFFVRCTGEADVAQLGAILRVGTIVEVGGAGSAYSGRYYVWSVRHTILAVSHRMRFVLVRNAVGPAAGGGLL
jgi:hypothetical protein